MPDNYLVEFGVIEEEEVDSARARLNHCLCWHSRPSRECVNLLLLAVATPLYGG
jgi:hypothetical protein